MTIRTRMAPSPTGEYHVGHLATLLKNYAFAKKHSGQFILRIEDTDQERKVDGAVQKILDVIHAYGLDWDEGPDKGGPYAPYTQSERLDIYKKYAQQLIDNQKAYYCFCTKERLEKIRAAQISEKKPPMYDRHCRSLSADIITQKLANQEPYVIRLAVPEKKQIKFTDLIRSEITIHSSIVDDQVLMKSDGFPTYHLAVVVDDHLMKITHILRGEEWISSTPKHVLLYEAFGWDQPVYAHIPVFLNPDGKGKMSKRKGTVSAQSFLDQGYLPEALLNFFMILGWAADDQKEIMNLERYIAEFDPSKISAKSVVFDLKKLDWINGIYIRSLPFNELSTKITRFLPPDFPKDKLSRILPLIFERLVKLSDVEQLSDFFYRKPSIDVQLLSKKSTQAEIVQQLSKTHEALSTLQSWLVPEIEKVIRFLQETQNWKKSQYFMMLRLAVTGKQATPPLFETIEVIGKQEVLERVRNAQTAANT